MRARLSAPFALKATLYSMLVGSSLVLTACGGGGGGGDSGPTTPVVDDGKATLKATVNDEAAFNQYDTDKDGSLTLAEAKAAASKLTQAAFDSLDTDKNAKLSLSELSISVTPAGVTVYFKKPASWGANINLHCWQSSPASACPTGTQWPGLVTSLKDGLYSYRFPADTLTSNVVFNDCAAGVGGACPHQTENLVFKPAEGICFDGTTNTWSSNADCTPSTKLSVNRPAGNFYPQQLNLVLATSEAQSYYTLDGSNPADANNAGRKSFKNDDIISLGKDLAVDASLTLKLASSDGSVTKDFAYTRKANDPALTQCHDAVEPIANPNTLSAERKAKFQDIRMYQIMVEAFKDGDTNVGYTNAYGPSKHGGDLKGIIDSLDYIKSLNVNAIWLTPVFDSDDAGGGDSKLNATGYFAKNFFDIDPKFGTKAQLKELVQAAHDRGLYVFLDGVFGHHKTGSVPASPCGYEVAGNSNPVSYPGSLEFYKEVATYWIREAGIDGWRLDQAYQVPPAYWTEIRQAVEAVSAERAQKGEAWGTLGYMVGELLYGDPAQIAAPGYGTADKPALYSNFDFPTRFSIMQILATQEVVGDEWAKGQPAAKLNGTYGFGGHSTYPAHALPNLFLTNHDVVRFGDLLQRGGFVGKDLTNAQLGSQLDSEYWSRHRAALSLLGAYSGPVTLYYGDEIGEQLEGFADRQPDNTCSNIGQCDDHVSRTTGNLDEANFNAGQKALKAYVAALFKLKAEHKALSQGVRTNLQASTNLLVDLKTAPTETILYVLNKDTADQPLTLTSQQIGEGKNLYLIDVLTGDVAATGSGLSLSVPPLSGSFYLVK